MEVPVDGLMHMLSGSGDASMASWQYIGDPEGWDREIMDAVMKLIPPSMRIEPYIQYSRIDRNLGYATGTVILTVPSRAGGVGDSPIMLPLAIRDFRLAPLDVMIQKGEPKMLTEERIQAHFATAEPTDALVDPRESIEFHDSSLRGVGGPDSGSMPYVPSSSVHYAAPAGPEALAGTVKAADVASMENWLRTSPALLAGLSGLGKAAAVRAILDTAVEGPPAPRTPDLVSWEKVAGKNRVLISRTGEDLEPQVIEVSDDGAKASIKDCFEDPNQRSEHLNRLYGTTTSTHSEVASELNEGADGKGDGPFLFEPYDDTPTQGERYGEYRVCTTSGNRIRGTLYPRLARFDGRPFAAKLFIGKSFAAIQPRIAVIPINEETDDTPTVSMPHDEGALPRRGETGFFRLRGSDGRVVGFEPIVIEDIYSTPVDDTFPGDEEAKAAPTPPADGRRIQESMVCVSGTRWRDGKYIRIKLHPMVDGVVDVTPKRRATSSYDRAPVYLAPAALQWQRLPQLVELHASPSAVKGAFADEAKLAGAQLHVIKLGGAYALRAPWTSALQEKVAVDLNGLSRGMAEHLLCSWGRLPPKVAARATAIADDRGRAMLCNFPGPVTIKLAGDIPCFHPEVLLRVRQAKTAARAVVAPLVQVLSLKGEVSKHANFDESQATLDEILRLNLFNPQNLSYFASRVPVFEKIESAIAKLLLAARMGANIPEDSLRTAMIHIREITEALEHLAVADEA